MRVAGGAVRVRRALSWRLCRELRESDLIASGGPGEFHILLTSPDAEHAERICDRLERMAGEINRLQPDEPPLELSLEVEPPLEAQPGAQPAAQAPGARAAAAAERPGRTPGAQAARGPVTTDREIERAASVEPGSERADRRRSAADPEEAIVPPRACEPPEPSTTA